MKPSLLLLLTLLFSNYSYFQSDSLKKEYADNIVFVTLKEKASELVKTQSSFVTIALYTTFPRFGSIKFFWKDEDGKIKGKIFYCSKDTTFEKKIKKKYLKRIAIDKLLEQNCVEEMQLLLDGQNKVDISHDMTVYINRTSKNDIQEVFFMYSNYLGERSECLKEVSQLIFL